MDLKLFLTTFAFIFMAELGDKTQLASMAAAAGAKSPWSVFAGAAAALVLSTLVAVLFGSTLQKYVPRHFLRGGAAILFFIFGAILLISAFRTQAKEPSSETAAPKPGFFGTLALKTAVDFEKAAAIDYRSLARQVKEEHLGKIFLHLAEEEEHHLAHMERLADLASAQEVAALNQARQIAAPADNIISESSRKTLEAAIAHEEYTARFYEEMASAAPIPSLRNAFAQLAREERSHAAHLSEYRDKGKTDLEQGAGS